MKRIYPVLLLFPLLAGCEQVMDKMHIPNPKKMEAEGRAIGSACRHAGRGLEDCYRLNPEAAKPAIFDGWKEMNEYMLKNKMQSVPSVVPPPFTKMAPAPDAHATEGEAPAGDMKDETDKKAEPDKQADADKAAGH